MFSSLAAHGAIVAMHNIWVLRQQLLNENSLQALLSAHRLAFPALESLDNELESTGIESDGGARYAKRQARWHSLQRLRSRKAGGNTRWGRGVTGLAKLTQ